MSKALSSFGRSTLGWLLPALLVAGWEGASRAGLIPANVLPAPSAVGEAFWKLLLSGELIENIRISTLRALSGFLRRRPDRLRTWSCQRAFLAQPRADRYNPADDPQHSASGTDPAGHSLVRYRRGGKVVSRRARRVLSDLRQHAARHPGRRSAIGRDGTHLRHVTPAIIPHASSCRAPCRRSLSVCAMRSASCG